MKKTRISLLMAALLTLSAAGCGKTQEPDTSSGSEAAAASVSEATESSVSVISTEPEEIGESAVSESEDPGTVSESTEAAEEPDTAGRYEIVIPQDQELIGVYHTIEGLTPEPGTYIAVVAKDLSSGYWKAVKAGAEQAVNDLNTALGYTGSDKIRMTFEGPAEEDGIDAQINTIDSVITDNPDVLCLGIIDSLSCQAQIELAGENGIPVIITDSGIENDAIVSRIAIDNREAGREAARQLAAAMDNSGQVLVIAHQASAQTSIDRVAGFTEEIAKNGGVLQVETIYEDSSTTLKEQIEAVLEKYPGISGVFCTNENMSVEFLKIQSKLSFAQPLKLIGFDSGETQIKAIEDGLEVGLISQNPYAEGYATVVASIRAVLDMELDAYVDTGFVYLDADTIQLEENQKYLYR